MANLGEGSEPPSPPLPYFYGPNWGSSREFKKRLPQGLPTYLKVSIHRWIYFPFNCHFEKSRYRLKRFSKIEDVVVRARLYVRDPWKCIQRRKGLRQAMNLETKHFLNLIIVNRQATRELNSCPGNFRLLKDCYKATKWNKSLRIINTETISYSTKLYLLALVIISKLPLLQQYCVRVLITHWYQVFPILQLCSKGIAHTFFFFGLIVF